MDDDPVNWRPLLSRRNKIASALIILVTAVSGILVATLVEPPPATGVASPSESRLLPLPASPVPTSLSPPAGPSPSSTSVPSIISPAPAKRTPTITLIPGPAPMPVAGSDNARSPAPDVVDDSDLPPVTVLNNSPVDGLGRQAAERVQEAGFTVDRVGNYSGIVWQTTVFYESGHESAARLLSDRVPEIDNVAPLDRDRIHPSGTLVLVVTKDFLDDGP